MNLSKDFKKLRNIYRNRALLKSTRELPPEAFAVFFRKWNRRGDNWPVDVEFDRHRQVFEVRDISPAGRRIHVSRASRVPLYKDGVENRIKFLWRQYLADSVEVGPGDVVLDIGANVGEFSMGAEALGATAISFEPDPQEFRSLQCNLERSKPFNLALWKESGVMTFYSKNASGDSSLIEMEGYSEKIDVQAETLDAFYERELAGVPVKLVKLEAEGAEPEIIEGGGAALRQARFIAVDAGPERGFDQNNTVVQVLDGLRRLGFELVRFGNDRHILLFENQAA